MTRRPVRLTRRGRSLLDQLQVAAGLTVTFVVLWAASWVCAPAAHATAPITVVTGQQHAATDSTAWTVAAITAAAVIGVILAGVIVWALHTDDAGRDEWAGK